MTSGKAHRMTHKLIHQRHISHDTAFSTAILVPSPGHPPRFHLTADKFRTEGSLETGPAQTTAQVSILKSWIATSKASECKFKWLCRSNEQPFVISWVSTCMVVPEPFEDFFHASSNSSNLFVWASSNHGHSLTTIHYMHLHTQTYRPIKHNCDSIIHDTLSKHQGIKVVVHLQVMEDSENGHCTSVHVGEEGKKEKIETEVTEIALNIM